LVWLSSCLNVGNKKASKPIYDEISLYQFVKCSAIKDQAFTLHLLDSILSIASRETLIFHKTTNYLANFYSDPNSSLRNEVFYDKILKAQMNSKWFSVSEKQDAKQKFRLLHQNDVGKLASDFEYWEPRGQRKTLHTTKAHYLLLIFYNPECEACNEVTLALKSSLTISNAIANGRLKVLCIYTDKDLKVWTRHLNEYPTQWLHGRDQNENLYKNALYDLRAIPTIYLLDQNKTVLLKDCTSVDVLEQNIFN
jgi:hypothetical protein